ncbi:probable myosin-binding protein 4 isoform X1 [Solanum tuberosum]|uniref:probable myosin-binding protein 4 isoform X1 n=1 Tax=Solanum tuberosum TaxID=4113 RepID=UPI00073A3E3D|nr:PREDICTED: probable myosin-binding protein 4 isoform X1 [Solanum tuberosum]
MAAGGISSGKQRNPRGFMTVLSSAVCEWFLMFLLFLDAALAYFIAKFASYYELQTPCMLCSRFNHILGDKKSGCYGSHLCRNHKEDVSFQVFCHIHGNLADVRAMCEECLVSFATENILIKESDNLMIDKLGNKSFKPSSPGPWNCSCCQKTWRARSSAQRLLQLTSVGFGASKANVKPPLPRAPGRSRFSRRDSFKKIRDKISGPESPRTRASALDPLSHVGYTELKITSDSESEIQMSDDEDGYSATHVKNDSRSEDNVRHGKGITRKLETDQPRQSSESKPYHLDRPMQLAGSSGKTVSFQASDEFVGHGLAELDWESLSPKTGASVLPEFISSYNVAQASNPLEDHHTSRESITSNVFLPRISDLSALSELISVTKTPSLSSINIHETDLTEGNDEGSNLTEKNNAKAPVHLDESAPPISNQKNQADISVVSNGRRKVSDRLGEPSAITDSANAGEGMKSLPQLSTSVTDESQTASLRNHDRLGEAKTISDSANAGEDMKSLPQLSTSVTDESQTASLRNHDRLGEAKAISDSANAGEGMKSLPQLSTSVMDESQTASLRNHDRLGEVKAISDSANAGEGMKSLPQLSTSVMDESQTASLRNHDRLGEVKAISDSANAGEGMKSLPQLSTSVTDESQTASLRNHDMLGEPSAISVSVNAGEGMKSLPQLSTSVMDESQTASLRNHDMLGEPSAISVSVNAGEGMKSLPQLSTSVMDESQIASLRNHDHSDDRQRSDASSSDGVHVIQTSTITGRDDSGNESADGFSVSDIEDESIVDRLKRQIEHDQRYINSLYKELEEERSASAIATNQAMAMITRLQEEKASLHMEALQYLRMMEEQAEYDMEALERANDQLADREKELQDLEEELLEYKNNIPDELSAEDPQKENKNLKEENVINGNHSLEHVENKLSGSSDSKTIRVTKICDKPRQFNDSICNFEDEKLCISKHLENLEKKLFQISGRKASDNVPCNGYSERVKKDVDNQVKKQSDDGGSINSQQEEEISSSTRNDFSKSNGGPIDKPAALDVENAIVSEKKNHLDNNHSKLSSLGGEVDGASIGNEISELSGRLQALEDDCKFLMHAFNSLQNGHEGIQLIQEIAHQLQEIRKVDFDKR